MWEFIAKISSVQSLSHVWLVVTPWTEACQASLSITNSWSSLRLTSIELVMPSNHLILCHPLLPLPSIFPSIRVFSRVSSSHQVAKVLSFSFNISPPNEYSGLISFRIDWLDLLGVQGTLNFQYGHHQIYLSMYAFDVTSLRRRVYYLSLSMGWPGRLAWTTEVVGVKFWNFQGWITISLAAFTRAS